MKKHYKDSSKGVWLTADEWNELADIASKADMTLHETTQHAVRYFINRYKSGKIPFITETKQVLPLK